MGARDTSRYAGVTSIHSRMRVTPELRRGLCLAARVTPASVTTTARTETTNVIFMEPLFLAVIGFMDPLFD